MGMPDQQRMSAGAASQAAGSGAQARSGATVFTTLGLILLTFMIYLFSMSEPSVERRNSVYASLAKAFLFSGRDQVSGAEGLDGDNLLSPGRDALRQLQLHLETHPGLGRIDHRGDDLVVTLNGARIFDAGSGELQVEAREATALLSQVIAVETGAVRVEATVGSHVKPVVAGAASLTRAVAVAEGFGNIRGPSARRFSAAGMGAEQAFSGPEDSTLQGRVRVILKDVETQP
ncbi:MAG: hypothetical protein ACE5FN_06730 [Leptospirillia bacterium]